MTENKTYTVEMEQPDARNLLCLWTGTITVRL